MPSTTHHSPEIINVKSIVTKEIEIGVPILLTAFALWLLQVEFDDYSVAPTQKLEFICSKRKKHQQSNKQNKGKTETYKMQLSRHVWKIWQDKQMNEDVLQKLGLKKTWLN